jgi:hypothetical protein
VDGVHVSLGGRCALVGERRSKAFFSEEKKQKTFISCVGYAKKAHFGSE